VVVAVLVVTQVQRAAHALDDLALEYMPDLFKAQLVSLTLQVVRFLDGL
jgi:hypothetical protein